jgi:hypothetical protein
MSNPSVPRIPRAQVFIEIDLRLKRSHNDIEKLKNRFALLERQDYHRTLGFYETVSSSINL